MAMNYEGSARNLIARGAYEAAASPIRTGFQSVVNARGALLRLHVSNVAAGSITDVNVYMVQPPVTKQLPLATERLLLYGFSALAIAAAGLYVLAVMPEGLAADISATAEKTGPWPCHFEVEVVLAGGSTITFQLDAVWIF